VTETPELEPLFPLPNVVLFPKTILPLHIFEPRYRLMMEQVLRGDQTLVMALFKPGWESDYYGSPPVWEVGCVGRVVQHQRLHDGRFNVTLHGERKVAIDGSERETPFRVARVHSIHEDRSWADSAEAPAGVADALSLFRRLHAAQGAAIEMAQVFGAHMGPEAIVNTIAMHLNVEPRVKQTLLEMERTEERFRAVHAYLRDSARTQETIDRVRHLYPDDRRQN
jgi:Lon protease-like protein